MCRTASVRARSSAFIATYSFKILDRLRPGRDGAIELSDWVSSLALGLELIATDLGGPDKSFVGPWAWTLLRAWRRWWWWRGWVVGTQNIEPLSKNCANLLLVSTKNRNLSYDLVLEHRLRVPVLECRA